MLYEYLTTFGVSFIGLLTLLTVWCRKDTIIRSLVLWLYSISIIIIGSIHLASLSHPIPYNIMSVFEDDFHDVLGVKFDVNNAIYVWLDFDDYPRYVVLPWSEELAKKIQGYLDREAEFGSKFGLMFGEDETEGIFHDKPQEALPPKEVPGYEIYGTPEN